jgi:hypothetical protein
MTVSNNAEGTLRDTGVVHENWEICPVAHRSECHPHQATEAQLLDGRRCQLCSLER